MNKLIKIIYKYQLRYGKILLYTRPTFTNIIPLQISIDGINYNDIEEFVYKYKK